MRIVLRMALYEAIERPMTNGRASSRVWRMRFPPGTSPTPVWPALSLKMTILRVNNGPCAPLKLSSMLSSPATGITNISVTSGAPKIACSALTFLSRVTAPANNSARYFKFRDIYSTAILPERYRIRTVSASPSALAAKISFMRGGSVGGAKRRRYSQRGEQRWQR